MDDAILAERLNQLGRLAETNVAAGTIDTGTNEITHEEADRIVASVRGHGATAEQIIRVIEAKLVFEGYRSALLRAAEWVRAKA